jgi:hypothetical protein
MLNNGLPLKAHQSKEKFEAKKLLKRAAEKRLAIVERRDGQARKPVCPLATQVALDPDLIDQWLAWITF